MARRTTRPDPIRQLALATLTTRCPHCGGPLWAASTNYRTVITNPKGIRDQSLWMGLTAIRMVVSQREINGASSGEIRSFIGSASATAEQYLTWVRGHWGIENSLHWVLDVCFREDEQRHWAGHSAENLSWMRKLALCLLKAEQTNKAKSINRRRHLAGWQNDYLLKVLAQIPENSDA